MVVTALSYKEKTIKSKGAASPKCAPKVRHFWVHITRAALYFGICFALFASERDDRILLCRDAGGDKPRNKGEQHAYGDKRNGTGKRELGNVFDIAQIFDNKINRDIQQQCCKNAEHAGNKSDNERFGIEHAGYIALGGADGTEYAYFLCAFEHRNIGYNAYMSLLVGVWRSLVPIIVLFPARVASVVFPLPSIWVNFPMTSSSLAFAIHAFS